MSDKPTLFQIFLRPYLMAEETCRPDRECIGQAYLMAEENCCPDREGRTSRGVSMGSTSLAAMPNPYCLLMDSPRPSTHITVDAVWSTADTCNDARLSTLGYTVRALYGSLTP